MIDLTPLEVRQKKDDFRRSFRGYDVGLVNDFLDLVADRMEELVGQNLKLTDRAEALDRELAEYRDKERALSEALMLAQRLQEESRAHAEREGELLIQEARIEAESLRQDAERVLAREEETLRRVRARRAHLVQSFRSLLERELSELAVIEETLELAGETDEQLRLLGTGGAADPGEDPESEQGPVVEGEIEAEPEPGREPQPELERGEAGPELVPETDPGTTEGEFGAPISEEEWETAWADGPATGETREAGGETGTAEEASPDRPDDPAPSEGVDPEEEEDWLSSLRQGLDRD